MFTIDSPVVFLPEDFAIECSPVILQDFVPGDVWECDGDVVSH